jgi:hypothetical protein
VPTRPGESISQYPQLRGSNAGKYSTLWHSRATWRAAAAWGGSVGREIARRGAEYAVCGECMVLLMDMFVVKTGMKVNM